MELGVGKGSKPITPLEQPRDEQRLPRGPHCLVSATAEVT
jgi:hypothetical protein